MREPVMLRTRTRVLVVLEIEQSYGETAGSVTLSAAHRDTQSDALGLVNAAMRDLAAKGFDNGKSPVNVVRVNATSVTLITEGSP